MHLKKYFVQFCNKFLLRVPDLYDVEYQNSSTLISASWHGFVDLESYIDHYEWCVGQTLHPSDDGILPCNDVGIQLSASAITLPLTAGKDAMYYIWYQSRQILWIIYYYCHWIIQFQQMSLSYL